MGQSKRMDTPRCPKCRKENNEVRHPDVISVKITGHAEYVTLKCSCGYIWKSTSQGAFRRAVSYKLATYGGILLGRPVKFSIRFDVEGTFDSLWAAEQWLHDHGYSNGSTGRGIDPVALKIGEYDLPQKWHNLTPAGKAHVDGVMFCGRDEPAIVHLFNLNSKVK